MVEPRDREESFPLSFFRHGHELGIIGFEGEEEHIVYQRDGVSLLCHQQSAVPLGTSPGESWLKSRFDLPYLRDIVMDQGILIDTSFVWKLVKNL